MELTDTDGRLLELLQEDFPLTSRPFKYFGRKCSLSENEVLKKTRLFIQNDLIREISGIFELRKLGYSSTLVAAEIDEEGLEKVTERINAHPGVGHNYLRNNRFNIWFTFAVPAEKSIEQELRTLLNSPHVKKYMELPTIRTYKINAQFKLTEKGNGGKVQRKLYNVNKDVIENIDKPLIRELQKYVQIVPEPFKVMSDNLNISEEELFCRIRTLKKSGVLRRIAGVLRHRKVGYSANAMVCWDVEPELIDETGALLSQYPEVTHCYRRITYDFWKYSLYSMIHGKNKEECNNFIETVKEKIDYNQCLVLYSSREFKKERVKYFINGF